VITTVAVELVLFLIETAGFIWAYWYSKKALGVMIKFHDYLITYRLTPRSRILRKHLPAMTMVIEEGESSMDQSSMHQSSIGRQS